MEIYMRYPSIALLVGLSLAACGPSTTPEQRATKKANIAASDAAIKNAKLTKVGGKTFRVAVVEGKNYALVDIAKPSAPYFPKEVELAARQVTGCKAEFGAGVLAFVGGDVNTLDLNALASKRKGKFRGWRADLAC